VVRPLVNRFKDANGVATQAARDLFDFASAKLETQTRVDIAVTGGTVGIATLAAAKDLAFTSLDLSRLHIWWGDERFVASDSSERNYLQAKAAWLKDLTIPSENLHVFPASDEGFTLEEAAGRFAREFDSAGINFDLMLMGMGPDGHIASLFPGKTAGDSNISVVAEHDSPKPPPLRLSFNFATINNSKEIWFTVAGADKAEAVATVFGDEPTKVPAGRISGKEKTVWYVDQTAGNLVWGC
jgi:6-phosphogluconolactonase